MHSIDDIIQVYKEAQNLIEQRWVAYRDGWKREGLKDLYQNVIRKAGHLKFLLDGGTEYDISSKEALLDIINYSAFSYYKVSQGRPFPIKLAMDCPTSWLGLVQPLADFDWISASQALRSPTYMGYFKDSKRPKVINNRKMGTGDPIPLEDIKRVWEITGGTVLAPDWLGDHQKTLQSYKDCGEVFGIENVIGVVQGDSPKALEDCLKVYGDRVAVPCDVGSSKEDPYWIKVCRRVLVVNALVGKKIHLLGLVHPVELSFYGECSNVESLNTAIPVLLAFRAQSMANYKGDKEASSYHLMDMDHPPIDLGVFRLLDSNIKELREHLR